MVEGGSKIDFVWFLLVLHEPRIVIFILVFATNISCNIPATSMLVVKMARLSKC